MSEATTCRYFTTYSGIALPFKLVGELDASAINNRNTFYQGYFNADGLLLSLKKIVYNEVEIEHRYSYKPDGTLLCAEITDIDGEVMVVEKG